MIPEEVYKTLRLALELLTKHAGETQATQLAVQCTFARAWLESQQGPRREPSGCPGEWIPVIDETIVCDCDADCGCILHIESDGKVLVCESTLDSMIWNFTLPENVAIFRRRPTPS